MKFRTLAVFTIVAPLLAACASNPRVESLTPEQRAKITSIQIFQAAPNKQYVVLGTVTGLSCNRNKYQAQDVSDAEALQGVKINAVLLGADAVINTFCQKNSDIDWVNNCWASVKCIGEAVKF